MDSGLRPVARSSEIRPLEFLSNLKPRIDQLASNVVRSTRAG